MNDVYIKLINIVNYHGELQLRNLNTIVFLVPNDFSYVDAESKSNKEDAKKGSIKHAIQYVKWLQSYFLDKSWQYKKDESSKEPLIHTISYGQTETENGETETDNRYLIVFQRPKNLKDKILNDVQDRYRKELFDLGWKVAEALEFTETIGGSHNAKRSEMTALMPYLNFQYDGTDVVIDIGYGTSRLAFAVAAMLQTAVYATDTSKEIFDRTNKICTALAKKKVDGVTDVSDDFKSWKSKKKEQKEKNKS